MSEYIYLCGDTESSKSSLGLLGIRERICVSCRHRRWLSVSTSLKSVSVEYLPFRERRQPGRNQGSLCVPMLLLALLLIKKEIALQTLNSCAFTTHTYAKLDPSLGIPFPGRHGGGQRSAVRSWRSPSVEGIDGEADEIQNGLATWRSREQNRGRLEWMRRQRGL